MGKAEIKRKEDIETFLEKVNDLNENLPEIIQGLNSKISEISSLYSSQMESVNGDFSKLQKGLEEEHSNFLGNLKSQFSDKKSYIENYVKNLMSYQKNVEKFSTDISRNFTNIVKNMEFEPFYDILSNYYSQINEIQHSIDFLKEDMIKLVKIKPNQRSIEDYRKNYRSLYRDKHIFLSLCDLKKYASNEEEATDLMGRNLKSKSGISSQSPGHKPQKRNKYSFPDAKSAQMPFVSGSEQSLEEKKKKAVQETKKSQEAEAEISENPMPVMLCSSDLYMANPSGSHKGRQEALGREGRVPNKESFATTASTTNKSKEKLTGNQGKLTNTNSTPATVSTKPFVQLNSNHSNENFGRPLDGENPNLVSNCNNIDSQSDVLKSSSSGGRKNYFKFDDELKREAQKLIETVDIFVGLENGFVSTERGMLVGEGLEEEGEPLEPMEERNENDLIDMDQDKVVIVSIKETLDEEEEKQKKTIDSNDQTKANTQPKAAKSEDFEEFQKPEGAELWQPTEISPGILDNQLFVATNSNGSMNFRRKSRERKDNPFVAATNVTPVNFMPNKGSFTQQQFSSIASLPGNKGQSGTSGTRGSGSGHRYGADSKSKEKQRRPESPMQVVSKRNIRKQEENPKNESMISSKKPSKASGKGSFVQAKAPEAPVIQQGGKSSIYTSILTNHKTGVIGLRHSKVAPSYPILGQATSCNSITAEGPPKEEKDTSPSLPVVTSGSNPVAKPLFFQTRTTKLGGGLATNLQLQQGLSGSSGFMGSGGNQSNLELYKKLQMKQLQGAGMGSGFIQGESKK